MATVNADPSGAVAIPQSNLLATLLQTAGTQTKTNPGDTTALQQVLQQLQGADYSAMLQSIFQQAGQQIPSLMGAYTSAVGARSSKNSAVEQALAKLLQQTTLMGQDQLARQQLQNQQVQTQAGTAVAQATKGTKQTQGQDLGNTAKLLALAQVLGQSGLLKKMTAAPAATAPAVGTAAPAFSGMNFSLSPQPVAGTANITGLSQFLADAFQPATSGIPGMAPAAQAAPQQSMQDALAIDFSQLFQPTGGQALVGGMDFGAPSLDTMTLDDFSNQDWFADFGG